MKSNNLLKLLTLLLTLAAMDMHSQNNTFPLSGNTGIGTTTPTFSKLVIQNPVTPGNASDNLRGLSVEKLTSTTTRRVFIIPHAGAGAYNDLTSENDAGLFWTDGANTSDGFKNMTSNFVIAPWAGSNAGIKILANGNVGIGSSNPYYKFEVANGSIYANQGALMVSNSVPEGGSVQIYNHLKMGTATRNFVQYNMTGGYGDKYSIWSYSADGTKNGERFGIWDNGDFTFNNSGFARNVTFLNNGNVGIGTDVPAAKLSIALGTNDVKNYGKGIQITNSNGNRQQIAFLRYGYNAISAGYNGASNVWGFGFSTETDNLFVPSCLSIDASNGKVGIGLTDYTKMNEANCKLFVAGGIMTEKVKVSTYGNWADYVFDEAYKLRSLKDVESFIITNRHLPNIPSAKEVREQGLDLAEIQAKQMEKIEELTLYIIEQSKQINKQNVAIEKMQQEIKQLKNK